MTKIGETAFYRCSRLTNVILSKELVEIGERAFSSCDKLTSITIPSSIRTIGEGIFNYCSKLKTIYFTGTENDWNNIKTPILNCFASQPTVYFVDSQTQTHITYRTHVQTYGWQDWKIDGDMSGTEGQAKRLEGINIKLDNQEYSGSVIYRTHIQTYGWESEWKTEGAMSGTAGEAKRLEGIQIVLVPKGGAAPGSTNDAYRER